MSSGRAWYDEKKGEKTPSSHSHSLFVVVTGTPESLFEMQRTLFGAASALESEIKKFEIKPIANS